jgi:hypothetical protein
VNQVRQLKQLQEENTRLKRVVADLPLDKAVLRDAYVVQEVIFQAVLRDKGRWV